MKHLIAALALLLATQAFGGRFKVTDTDHSGVWVEYSGSVELDDAEALNKLMREYLGQVVYIKINSPGGSAYGGIMLYYEAEKWDNLVTFAGKDYGAWSAAAIFWLGSPRDFYEDGAQVGFHAAYCNFYFPPGCDTSGFQTELKEILRREGFEQDRFNATLNWLQENFGVNAWLIFSDNLWYVRFPHRSPFRINIPRGPLPLTPDRIERLLDEMDLRYSPPYWRERVCPGPGLSYTAYTA